MDRKGLKVPVVRWAVARTSGRLGCLVVNFDVDEVEAADASASEGGGAQEDGGSEPPGADNHDAIDVHPRAKNGAKSSLFRAKFGSLMGRSIAVRALGRWSSRNVLLSGRCIWSYKLCDEPS
ncbi:hypothetical protein Droror1_Dr00016749 [Drosera rotundifolia]